MKTLGIVLLVLACVGCGTGLEGSECLDRDMDGVCSDTDICPDDDENGCFSCSDSTESISIKDLTITNLVTHKKGQGDVILNVENNNISLSFKENGSLYGILDDLYESVFCNNISYLHISGKSPSEDPLDVLVTKEDSNITLTVFENGEITFFGKAINLP